MSDPLEAWHAAKYERTRLVRTNTNEPTSGSTAPT